MDHIEKQQRKIHPRQRTNFVSNIFFIYALKLFKKGYKQDLQEKDLYEVLSDYRSKNLGDRLEQQWEKQKKSQQNSSIVRLLWSCYGLYFLLLGLMQLFINLVVMIIQPYCLGRLVAYFVPGQEALTKKDAYFYASVVIGLNFFQCVYQHNCNLLVTGFGIKIRTAFCSFMYRKVLKLSPAHLGDISMGKIVTLITRDVEALEVFVEHGNHIWIAIVETIVISFILYNRIGLAAFAGVGFLFIIMPLQMYLSSKGATLKMKMCKETDVRLRIIQETLSAIRVIKMYTWEKIFYTKISNARKSEVRAIFNIAFLRATISTIGSLSSYIAFYIVLMTYIWHNNKVTAEIIYFVLSTFQSLSNSLNVQFPNGTYLAAELTTAIKRIGNIVRAKEVEALQSKNNNTTSPKISFKNVTISIKDKKVLHEINLEVKRGLTLITGSVGSGKSVFLKTILQDYKPEEGKLMIEGTKSYASQDPWLFPSSIRQNILFGQKYDDKRYQEVLRVCALVYDLELLEAGDNTMVEDRGINLSKGQQTRVNLARAIYQESAIYLLDDCLSALDANVSAFIFKECIRKFLGDKLIILATHNVNYLKDVDNVIILHDGSANLTKNSELNVHKLLHNPDDIKASIVDNVDQEDTPNEDSKLITETTNERRVYGEVKRSGSVDSKVYKKYIQLGGGFILFSMIFSIFISAQLSTSYTDKLISNWVNMDERFSNYTAINSTNATVEEELKQQRSTKFYMYTFVVIATTLTTLARTVSVLLFIRRASINIHKNMITTIINGSMRFFDIHFIGNILNRFSKDMMMVDEYLPSVVQECLKFPLILIGAVSLIASVNMMLLIPTAIFAVILILLRAYFIPTGRNLRRLDTLTRCPVVGHMNATLEGLTTIRAFKAESILRDEFDRHQNLYTSASYVSMNSVKAFAFTLDMLCGFLVALIVTRFLIIDNDTLAGDVGLAISQALMLTGTLQWGIREWTELENQMTFVERALEYTEIAKENKQGLVLENWPKLGEIKYQNVNLSYTSSSELVLKNINFTVRPKEKIGIVGRTGAGKSSIIFTLFRLYEVDGTITIDDVDTKTLSLDFLRSKISIIPQDPVLFTGTIRDNIDPTGTHTDEEIWSAMETANLKNLVPDLDFDIVEGGSNFSVGQRQLICLARAVVLRNKIVVLDEATAHLDAETEELIHQTMRKNFDLCTVFTIAHNLNSVLNSDKVIVLDKGEIVEYDEPANLLKNKDGVFHEMVAKSGLLSRKIETSVL